MNRVRARDQSGGDNRGFVQIRVFGGGGADANGFVGHADMHGVRVGGRMDGNRFNPHFPARAVNAQSDFTAVCD